MSWNYGSTIQSLYLYWLDFFLYFNLTYAFYSFGLYFIIKKDFGEVCSCNEEKRQENVWKKFYTFWTYFSRILSKIISELKDICQANLKI